MEYNFLHRFRSLSQVSTSPFLSGKSLTIQPLAETLGFVSLFRRTGFFPTDHHGGTERWRNTAHVHFRRVVPTAPCAVEGHGRKGYPIIFRGPDSRQPWTVPCGGISVGHKQLCCECDLLHQQPPSWGGENGNFFSLRLVLPCVPLICGK